MHWNPSVVKLSLALFLALSLAFSPTLAFDFTDVDDPVYVTANPQVLSGLSLDNLSWAFSTVRGGLYQPLVWLSLQLDASLGGGHPAVFHLHNVWLHALGCLVFFWFLILAGLAPNLAFWSVLLFGLHPLRAESVAWVTERKDVLSFFWASASMLGFAAHQQRRRGGTALWLTAYALALLSKAMMVTLPLATLLVGIWPAASSRHTLKVRLLQTAGLLVPAALLTGLTLKAARREGYGVSPEALPWQDRWLTVPEHLLEYVQKTLLPVDLSVLYYWQPATAAGLAAAAAFALAWAFLLWRLRQLPLFIGSLWFLLALTPALGIAQAGMQRIADRFTHWPHALLFAGAVAALHPWLKAKHRWLPWTAGSLAVALSAALLQHTLPRFRNYETVLTSALSLEPHNDQVRYNLGTSYFLHQRYADTLLTFEPWLKSGKAAAETALMAAFSWEVLGDRSQAERWYRHVLSLPRHPPEAEAMWQRFQQGVPPAPPPP